MSRILVIDDDEAICNSVKSILEKEGYEVDTSLSGESGIEKVKSANYDLVYLDIHMPGMGSLDTFRAIRAIKKDAKVCVITAMADEHMTEYLLLIKEGAIDKIVRKPVFRDALLKITGELMGGGGMKKKILIIDDDEMIREAFKSVLKEFNYDLDFAKTAKEVEGLFRRGKYNLIFLDLALPDGDGGKILTELRLKDKDTKICVMSGYLSRLGNLLAPHNQAVVNTIFCMKPISREEIIKITKGAIES
ncbi:MAG: response regulator [Candidatus Omnitrophota bacterium]